MDDPRRLDGERVLVVGCQSGMGQAAAKIVWLLGAAVQGFDTTIRTMRQRALPGSNS